MPRIHTLNNVGNGDGSKLGSPPSNRYPLSRLELEEQLKNDRKKFIRSAKQLIAKYHALDKKISVYKAPWTPLIKKMRVYKMI